MDNSRNIALHDNLVVESFRCRPLEYLKYYLKRVILWTKNNARSLYRGTGYRNVSVLTTIFGVFGGIRMN